MFCDEAIAAREGVTFALSVRRFGAVLNPMLPIFMFHERVRRRTVETARDAGATGVITCPISPRTVMTKLEAALTDPRPFIKAPEFFGPDRRAKERPAYAGVDRRSRIPRKVRIQKYGRDTADTTLL